MRKLWLVPLSLIVAISLSFISSADSPSIWVASGDIQKTVIEVGTKNFSTGDKYCDVRTEYELQYPAVNGVRIPGSPKKEPVEACWYQTDFGQIGYANRLSRLYVKDTTRGENVIRVTGQPAGLWASLGTSSYMMFQTTISSAYKRLNLYDNTKQRLTISKTGWYDQYTYDGTTNRWTLPGFNGNPLGTNATGYSQNGEWIVAETSHGFMRINTQTKDTLMFGALLFGYGYGQDPSHELTISNDGRYAVVAGGDINKRIFHMYDLATCVKGADPFAIATSCTKRDIKTDIFPELANNKSVSRIIFGSDATDLTYNYQLVDGTANRALLTAPGRSVHIMDYIALGDSYTSGEGEYEGEKYYLKGTDGDGEGVDGYDTGLSNFPYDVEKCHVSTRSYPNLIGSSSGLRPTEYRNIACSGSVLFDTTGYGAESLKYTGKDNQLSIYTDSQGTMEFLFNQALAGFVPGRTPQIEFIKKYKPEVVTLGIGGNDINFSGKIAECVMPGTCSSANELRHYAGLEIHSLHKKLVDTYKKLSDAGKTTRFFVIGYPQMVSQDDTCAENVRLNFEERILARSMTSYLNEVIKSAAESVGFTYLDIEYALAGEMLCDEAYGGKAAQGLAVGDDRRTAGPVTFYIGIGNESFHPTHIGHEMITEAINSQLNNSSIIEYRKCAVLDGLRCPSGNSVAPPIPEYFTSYSTNQTEYVVDSKSFDSIYYVDEKAGLGKGIVAPVQPPTANDGTEIKLAPNQAVPVTMHSTPQQVGIMSVDANGLFSGSITIPQGAEPGPHTLVINAKDSLYRDMTMYQQIFVYDTLEDFDGDGVLNTEEKCGMFEPMDQDEDRDGIDDACDGIIGDDPDITAPTITPNLSLQPNDAGWFKDDVEITWSITDDIDTELAAPAEVLANKEGEHTYTSEEVCDVAGNCATGSVTLKIDTVAPVVNGLTLSKNPKAVGEISTMSASISDETSGATEAEYFIADDPGLGNGATMMLDGSTISTQFGTDFGTGVYKISARAQDQAGNWSMAQSDFLVVYDASSGVRFRGARSLSLVSEGNQLPWVTVPTQSTGKFAFSVRYGNDGAITKHSDFQFAYKTGDKCYHHRLANNCHNFELNSTRIAWLTTSGVNQSLGTFSGDGVLTMDKQSQPVRFVVHGVDGERMSPFDEDQFSLTIYASMASEPMYFVAPTNLKRGDIKIRF